MLAKRKLRYSAGNLITEVYLKLGQTGFNLNAFLLMVLQSSIIILLERYIRTKVG